MTKLSEIIDNESPSRKYMESLDTTSKTLKLSDISEDMGNKSNNLKELGQNILGGAVTLGAIGGGGYLIGKGIQKGANIFARVGAGLSQRTIDTAKEVGLNKIKTIGMNSGEYLSKKVIPEARRNIIRSLVNYKNNTDVLDTLGFKPSEVEAISEVSKGRLVNLGNQISSNWSKMSKNLEESTKAIGKKIDNVYNVAEKIGVSFSIPKSYGIMRSELRKYGLVDLTGNLTREAETISSPTLKNYAKIYNELHTGIQGKGEINIPQYRNLINQLEGSLGTEEKFNVPIYKTVKTLRNEGAYNVNPSAKLRNLDIVKLNKEYSDNITLQTLGKKLNDVINESPEKLEGTFNKLSNDLNSLSREKYAKIYGNNLIKDIDIISTARELYPDRMGGWTRWGSRQLVKGAMKAEEAIKSTPSGLKQITSKLGKLGSKGLKALGPVGMVMDALKYSNDPDAYLISLKNGEDYWEVKNKYPKDSEERKILLGQIL